MITRRTLAFPAAAFALTAALVAGCGHPGGGANPPPSRSSTSAPPPPAATESNPPGDIPDNQAYVVYQPSGGGFSVKVPEGWARVSSGTSTAFTDKLNRIEIAPASASAAPTPQSVTSQVVPVLRQHVPKFALGKVSTVSRHASQAVLLTYQGDSAPDPVTGKVVRDAFERYAFYHNGREVDLTLSGPVQADNVDPWRIVTDSFGWR
jgi:hypothetical protein